MAPSEPSPATAPTQLTESPSRPPQAVIDLTDESDRCNTPIYPTVGELLGELDENSTNPGFARYEDRLMDAGFRHVHQVVDTSNVQQDFDRLVIPVEIRHEIFERAARMVHRAEKSKQVIKTEDPSSV